ncbi:MAG: hypothetical protein PVI23_01565 [Maricaulaceae bacterium]|jgi:hypothetical protein
MIRIPPKRESVTLRSAGAAPQRLRGAVAVLGAVVLASAAACDDTVTEESELVEPFFGNTIAVALPDLFYEAEWHVDPDHTYRVFSSMGDESGRWDVVDGEICFERTEPQAASSMCYPAARRTVGESWSEIDPYTGNTVEMSLIEGR